VQGITEAANVVGISRQARQNFTGKVTDPFIDGRRWRVPIAPAEARAALTFRRRAFQVNFIYVGVGTSTFTAEGTAATLTINTGRQS
jgi:hypothetical protein